MKSIKCTVVGDHFVGKGSLLRTYVNGSFREEAEPIIFDNFLVTPIVDKKICQLTLWYANGMEEYDRLRPLSYPGTHIILLCFSIDDISSFYNVKDKWIPEMTHYCPQSPILLVGLKIDLRLENKFVDSQSENGSENQLITYHEGFELANEIGAIKYMEVSSMRNYGLNELFEEAVRTAILMCDFDENQQRCKRGCVVV